MHNILIGCQAIDSDHEYTLENQEKLYTFVIIGKSISAIPSMQDKFQIYTIFLK